MSGFKANLLSFTTGTRHGVTLADGAVATVLVEDTRDLQVLTEAGLVQARSVPFAPTADVPSCPTPVVAVSGSASRCGGELEVGADFYLQVQGYAMAGFLTLVGPTLVRVEHQEDAEAFVADADLALEGGRFQTMLTYPLLHLADPGALGLPTPFDGPGLRLYVDRDHQAHVGPNGPVIGPVDSLDACATARLEPPPPLPPGAAALVRERPWLGRYLVVVAALQSFVARNLADVRVSGFGGRLIHDCAAGGADLTDPLAPVLARSEDSYLVYLPPSGRTFRATPQTAALVERFALDPTGVDPGEVHPKLLSVLGSQPAAAR